VTNYRRNFVSGGSYFFTVNLLERRLRLLVDHVDLLREVFRYVRRRHPFDIEAIVVLPDHLHAIWTLPENDSDYALRWRLIKSAFSRGLSKGERISPSRAGKGERASGNAAIGSTLCATNRTSRGTPITSTTIQ
jgi:putative transposase